MINVEEFTKACYEVWVNYHHQRYDMLNKVCVTPEADLASCIAPIRAEYNAVINILLSRVDLSVQPNITLVDVLAQKQAIVACVKSDDELADEYSKVLSERQVVVKQWCGECIAYRYADKAVAITTTDIARQYLLTDILMATRMAIQRAQEQTRYMLEGFMHRFTYEQIIEDRDTQIADALKLFDMVVARVKPNKHKCEDAGEERNAKRRKIDWTVTQGEGLKLRFEAV